MFKPKLAVSFVVFLVFILSSGCILRKPADEIGELASATLIFDSKDPLPTVGAMVETRYPAIDGKSINFAYKRMVSPLRPGLVNADEFGVITSIINTSNLSDPFLFFARFGNFLDNLHIKNGDVAFGIIRQEYVEPPVSDLFALYVLPGGVLPAQPRNPTVNFPVTQTRTGAPMDGGIVIPEIGPYFTFLAWQGIENGRAVFHAAGEYSGGIGIPEGIFIQDGGDIRTIALNDGMPLPDLGFVGRYDEMEGENRGGLFNAAIGDSLVAFSAADENSKWGLFSCGLDGCLSSGVSKIATHVDRMPGSAENFQNFSAITIDNDEVYFYAESVDDHFGIYRWDGTTIDVIVDRYSSVSGYPAGLKSIDRSSIGVENDRVVFSAETTDIGGSGTLGIFYTESGVTQRAIGVGDTVSGFEIGHVNISHDPISDTSIAVRAVHRTDENRLAIIRLDLW